MRLLAGCVLGLLLVMRGLGQESDPGKEVVGSVVVRVIHATDGEVAEGGDKSKPVTKAVSERLQSEARLKFAHYREIGVDTKPLYRSYENWAQPLGASDEVLVRFEAQSRPAKSSARLGLEFWLSRKKILKTDAEISSERPLYVLGPAWRGGRLIISVALASTSKPRS